MKNIYLNQVEHLSPNEDEIGNLFPKAFKLVYTQKEVLGLLDISPNTLKKYRENGYISYSKVDDKYYYSSTDIIEFLKNTHYDAFYFQD